MGARDAWSGIAGPEAAGIEEHDTGTDGPLFDGTPEIVAVLLLFTVLLLINIDLFLF